VIVLGLSIIVRISNNLIIGMFIYY
jgi:hypothetical protein